MFEITKNHINYIIDDVKVGYILFDEKDNYIVGSYIYVNPEYRGKGFSVKLVDCFVEFSKEKNKLILPTCPVIKRILENKYKEVVR